MKLKVSTSQMVIYGDAVDKKLLNLFRLGLNFRAQELCQDLQLIKEAIEKREAKAKAFE